MSDQIDLSEQKFECDGGGSSGHPKVYIYGDKATCPYCGKVFSK